MKTKMEKKEEVKEKEEEDGCSERMKQVRHLVYI